MRADGHVDFACLLKSRLSTHLPYFSHFSLSKRKLKRSATTQGQGTSKHTFYCSIVKLFCYYFFLVMRFVVTCFFSQICSVWALLFVYCNLFCASWLCSYNIKWLILNDSFNDSEVTVNWLEVNYQKMEYVLNFRFCLLKYAYVQLLCFCRIQFNSIQFDSIF